MPASRTKSFRFGHDLADIADLRAKQLGYQSATDYVKALIRYDTLCQSRHSVTIPWSIMPLGSQDDLDARLLRRTLQKLGMTAMEAAKVDWREL